MDFQGRGRPVTFIYRNRSYKLILFTYSINMKTYISFTFDSVETTVYILITRYSVKRTAKV